MSLDGIVSEVLAEFAAIPAAEWVAVLSAVGYLLLAVRQNSWCWAFAIVSSAVFLVLFTDAGLVMQAALQLFFIGMAVYGWWAWRLGGSETGAALPVSRWSGRRHAASIAVLLVLTVVNGWIVARGRGGVVPYVDAFVAWVSVLATWMVARKVLENWVYWIVVDSVAAVLYWSQGLHATTVLFVVYVVIAIRGYFAWRGDLLQRSAPEPGRVGA